MKQHFFLNLHGPARLHDRLKPLCLYHYNAYGQKTWQDGYLT